MIELIILIFAGLVCLVRKFENEEKLESSNYYRKRREEMEVLVNEGYELQRALNITPNEEWWALFINNSHHNFETKIQSVKENNANLRYKLNLRTQESQPEEFSDKELLQKVKCQLLFLLTSEKQSDSFLKSVERTIKVIESLAKNVK